MLKYTYAQIFLILNISQTLGKSNQENAEYNHKYVKICAEDSMDDQYESGYSCDSSIKKKVNFFNANSKIRLFWLF
jgi:hypothetical protein